MIILLSPAKRLQRHCIDEIDCVSCPRFISYSKDLIENIKEKSPKEIEKLMGISKDLSELNYKRFQNWDFNHNYTNSKPAIELFYGDAYKSLDAKSLNNKELKLLNEKLFILSGLYGLLRPFDLIQKHRLEMGTKLKNNRGNNLYDFWKEKITSEIKNSLSKDKTPIIINLASNEYFKVINKKKLNYPVIDINFKEEQNGTYKTVAIFAKKARGLMTRFIIENNIDEIEELIAFNYEGYNYSKDLSSKKELVFYR
jgi:cytoplasmic iron level regulating protein YaaA (DUF328/UPF0246 family)